MNRRPSASPETGPGTAHEASLESVALTAWRNARRIVVFVVGGTLLLLGVVLLVLPGPAFIVIPTALAILALEFRWARRLLRRARAVFPSSQEDKAASSSPRHRSSRTHKQSREHGGDPA